MQIKIQTIPRAEAITQLQLCPAPILHFYKNIQVKLSVDCQNTEKKHVYPLHVPENKGEIHTTQDSQYSHGLTKSLN